MDVKVKTSKYKYSVVKKVLMLIILCMPYFLYSANLCIGIWYSTKNFTEVIVIG